MDSYLTMLSDIHKSGIDNIKNASTSTDKFNAFETEIKNYLNFIPEFFSETGDAKSIRNIYSKMSDRRNSDKKIDFIDINQSAYIYKEYSDGMKKFISEIIESDVVTETSNIITNLDNAISNDSLFIESIFGGSNNVMTTDTIKDASKNLEFLVDFIPTLESYIDDANMFVERVDALSKVDDVTVLKTLDMYMESVSHYAHQVMENVIKTYLNIQSILSTQPVNVISKQNYVLY